MQRNVLYKCPHSYNSIPYFWCLFNFLSLRYEDLPREISPLDLHYFDEAVDFVTEHKNVTQGGVGVIGMSKGAEIALHMAINRDTVKV